MERRTEQAKASAESAISEKQASKSNTNDIAVIYEKSNPSNLKMVTYAKPSTVKAMALSKSSIKDVQTKLNAIGYSCGTPDGTFGAGTETALKNFQKANKLTVDGLAGSATLNAINKEVEKLNKPNPNPGQYNTVTQEGIAYSKSKEGLSLKPYNNGKTIGYGMDIANFPDIKINYQKDGSITKQEADRLFEIVYNRFADKVNSYLDSKNIKLDQYSYAAAVDLVYNRGMNDMTKEVIDAMGANNTKKVKSLLSDFDYRYAKEYLYKNKANPDAEAIAYVERNPGLKTRREEEYIMFSEKRFLV